MSRLDILLRILKNRNNSFGICYETGGASSVYFRSILGINLRGPAVLYISKDEINVFGIEYLAEDFTIIQKNKIVKLKLFSEDEFFEFTYLLNKLQDIKKIVLIGEAPFGFVNNFLKKNIIVEQDYFLEFIYKKSLTDIKKIKKISKLFSLILEDLSELIFNFKTIQELNSYLKTKIINQFDNFAFPISIQVNEGLMHSTVGLPNNLGMKDVYALCIDAGGVKEGLYTDCTRMYFRNPDKLEIYNKLRQIHLDVISELDNLEEIKDILKLYEKKLKIFGDELKHFGKADLGHGIGYELHEYPYFINTKTNNFKIKQEGFIFTLEPEIQVNEFKYRIEDMILFHNGKFHKLT